MLSGNKRFQRFTVGLIIGLVVLALALTLVGPALAASPAGPSLLPEARALLSEGTASTPTSGGSTSSGFVGTGEPKPVTDTPQGTTTQVSDKEHLGGLIGFIAFMLGGVLLMLRAKRRERRERALAAPESILSGP